MSGAGFGEFGIGGTEFSDETLVVDDVLAPIVEFGEKGLFDFGVGRVVGEVVDFVRIFFEVEELHRGFLGSHEGRLGGGEFSFEIEDIHFRERGVGTFLIVAELAVGAIRHQVEDELVIL